MSLSPRTAAGWYALRHQRGRIAWSALFVSCLVHVLVLILTPIGEVVRAPDRRPDGSSPSAGSRGLQFVIVAPRQPLTAERPDPSETATAVGPAAEFTSIPREAPLRTSRLERPAESTRGSDREPDFEDGRKRNPLIWNGFSDLRLAAGLPILRPEDALADALAQPKGYVSPLKLCYDSLDARAARAREALDWSRRDSRGWRWGISADGIHLGPVTVPIAPPAPPPGEANWRPERDPCVDR